MTSAKYSMVICFIIFLLHIYKYTIFRIHVSLGKSSCLDPHSPLSFSFKRCRREGVSLTGFYNNTGCPENFLTSPIR
jgi:hypothetical protein